MKHLDPKAVWFFFVGFVLRWSIVMFFLSIWGSAFLGGINGSFDRSGEFSFGFLNWLWMIIPAFLVLCFVWAKLTYHFYRYELTDAGFRKELGVIYKKYVTIPYDRIQNVDIYRGILARILGLSDLNLQTAGASATVSRFGAAGMRAEGRLPALSRETAEQLRDELVQRARHSKNQGL
ncbi:MAG: PH domain-containing protein [bacterium]|nr:PH domain-containing protein [bacterium]